MFIDERRGIGSGISSVVANLHPISLLCVISREWHMSNACSGRCRLSPTSTKWG